MDSHSVLLFGWDGMYRSFIASDDIVKKIVRLIKAFFGKKNPFLMFIGLINDFLSITLCCKLLFSRYLSIVCQAGMGVPGVNLSFKREGYFLTGVLGDSQTILLISKPTLPSVSLFFTSVLGGNCFINSLRDMNILA
jgi:hypothetical protein